MIVIIVIMIVVIVIMIVIIVTMIVIMIVIIVIIEIEYFNFFLPNPRRTTITFYTCRFSTTLDSKELTPSWCEVLV